MNKHLVVLLALTLLALGAGYWLVTNNVTTTQSEGLLLPDFAVNANDIDKITVENTNGEVLTAKRENKLWKVSLPEFSRPYPASTAELAELMNNLSQAKILETKTAREKNYYRLGLQDISQADSVADKLVLSKGYKSWQLLVGNHASSGLGSYVRRVNGKQSWLIDKFISLPSDPSDWLEKRILPFEQSEFLKIARVDQASWSMERGDAEQEFTLSQAGQNQNLKYPGILKALANNLSAMEFQSLRAYNDPLWTQAKLVLKLDVVGTNTRFSLLIKQQDENYLLRFDAPTEQGEWLEWVFQVSEYSAKQLIKMPQDFLQNRDSQESPQALSGSVDEGESPQ